MHGALFFYEEQSRIRKVRCQDSVNLLTSITEKWEQDYIPVFVSEGSPDQKLMSIYSNLYLSFVFDYFLNIDGGITVFGHSLSLENDKHIVEALNNNLQLTHIAISIYRGQKTDEEIEDEIDNFKSSLRKFTRRQGILEFYDSSTSPLSYDFNE